MDLYSEMFIASVGLLFNEFYSIPIMKYFSTFCFFSYKIEAPNVLKL